MRVAFDSLVSTLKQVQSEVLTIYCPAWEGGHQDHDATHVIALTYAMHNAPNCASIKQFSLYHGKGLPGPFFWVHKPLTENGPVTKVRSDNVFTSIMLSRRYPSQWKTWIGLTPFFAMGLLFSRSFLFQEVDKKRIHERPHAGSLLYERRFHVPYDEVRQYVDGFIEAQLQM
jgi:hypothetical protein